MIRRREFLKGSMLMAAGTTCTPNVWAKKFNTSPPKDDSVLLNRNVQVRYDADVIVAGGGIAGVQISITQPLLFPHKTACFKLTAASFQALTDAGLPNIVALLQNLKGQKFCTEKAFWKAVRKAERAVKKKLRRKYKRRIQRRLKYL